jgi:CelD/BcsL family acetyltransferase involved in cellulose biosynthesis
MAIRIEIFRSIEDARDVWLDFQEKGDLYLFQTLEWLENWFHHIGTSAAVEPCLVAVFDETAPVYFFPMGIVRKRWGRTLVWLGGDLCDYGAPIVVPKSPGEGNDAFGDVDFPSVWAEILRRIPTIDVIWLVRIPERIDGRPNPMCRLKCDAYHSRAYATKLVGTWDEIYETHAGPKTRSTDRRKARRLAEIGEVSWTITDGGDDAAFRRITETMIEQKERRYREIRARNVFHDQAHRKFFSHPVDSLVRTRRLNLSELSVAGRIVTTHWGMVYRDRFYYFMPSFAEGSWARFSPGRLLLFRLLQWCVDRGSTVFDFTVGDEAYKTDWCDEEMVLYQYFAPRTAKGRLFGIFYAVYLGVVRNKPLLGLARKLRRFSYSLRYRVM